MPAFDKKYVDGGLLFKYAVVAAITRENCQQSYVECTSLAVFTSMSLIQFYATFTQHAT